MAKAKTKPRSSRGDRLLRRLLSDHFYVEGGGSVVWSYGEGVTLKAVDPKLDASLRRWAKKRGYGCYET